MPNTEMTFDEVKDQIVAEVKNANKDELASMIEAKLEESKLEQEKQTNSEAVRELPNALKEFREQLHAGGGAVTPHSRQRGTGTSRNKTLAQMLPVMAGAKYDSGAAVKTARDKWGADSATTKALEATDFSAGGALLDRERADIFIEELYANNIVLSLGAVTIDITGGGLKMGKQNQKPTFYWVGEGEAIQVSQPGYGQVLLNEHEGAVLVPISNRLIDRLPAGMEQMISESMVATTNNGLDTAYLSGEGTQASPKGIYNWVAAAQKKAIPNATGTSPTLADVTTDLLGMYLDPLAADINGLRYGWGMAPRTMVYLMSLRTSDGFHVFLDELREGMLYGYPVGVTTNIPTNRDDSGNANNDETRLYFGDFSEAVVGQGRDVRVEEATQASFEDTNGNTIHGFQQGVTLTKVSVTTDFALMHNEAFSVRNEVRWSL